MSRKIKFHTFHVLFRLFAYLADKSGGWRVFVRPKLLIGSLIVGLGLTSCGTKTENKPTEKRAYPNSSKKEISKTDSIPGNKNNSPPAQLVKCYTGPVITKDKVENKSSNTDSIKESLKSSKDSTQVAFCYGIDDPQGKDIADNFDSLHQVTDSDKIYEVVDQMPEFPGGNDSLLLHIAKGIKYPSNESLQNIQGKIVCRCVINKNGSVSDIEIIRSLHPVFDAEAIRVIKTLPNFIPGKQNGKLVRAYYVIPIILRLQ